MNTDLNIIQRFLADTPPFFKKFQIFGLFLFGVAGHLAGLLPQNYIDILSHAGLTIALFSQLAVKDCGIIASAANPLDGILEILQQLPGQYADLKNAVISTPVITIPAPVAPVNITTPVVQTDTLNVTQVLQPPVTTEAPVIQLPVNPITQ